MVPEVVVVVEPMRCNSGREQAGKIALGDTTVCCRQETRNHLLQVLEDCHYSTCEY